MSRPTLRRELLLRSIDRHLGDDTSVRDAVVMWTRHRWFLPYALGAGILLWVVAAASDVEPLASQIAIGAAGAAVGAVATTNYWILADTTTGLALLRSSRIRQRATAFGRHVADDETIEMVGSTVITSDWRIDDVIYTLTKRWEATMRLLSTEQRRG